MARASQQSTGPVTVWMIVFAALWLTSTVFLIVLYTGQEELVADADRLRRVNEGLISEPERRSIKLVQNLVAGGETAVGILERTRRETSLLATGSEEDEATAVRAKRDKLYEGIRTDEIVPGADEWVDLSLLEGMADLYDQFKSQHTQLNEATSRVEALDTEVARLQELTTSQQSDFEKRAKEFQQQLAAAEGRHEEYRGERDQAVTELETEFQSRAKQADDDLNTERLTSARMKKDLEGLQQRVEAQDRKFGELKTGPQALATARQPDGRIVLAVPGDDVVYIDRGSKHRLTLGLRFAVYSAEGGVPTDGRAKAQIEVSSILSDSSAECSIKRIARDAVIFEGDVIANPIYDAASPQTFLVVGTFDLDRDGSADVGGSATIESLIVDWGGRLGRELNAGTDFVVLGRAPRPPREGSTLTPEQEEQQRKARSAFESYGQTVASASALAVPVLSQDVFLNFLGYRASRAR